MTLDELSLHNWPCSFCFSFLTPETLLKHSECSEDGGWEGSVSACVEKWTSAGGVLSSHSKASCLSWPVRALEQP